MRQLVVKCFISLKEKNLKFDVIFYIRLIESVFKVYFLFTAATALL